MCAQGRHREAEGQGKAWRNLGRHGRRAQAPPNSRRVADTRAVLAGEQYLKDWKVSPAYPYLTEAASAVHGPQGPWGRGHADQGWRCALGPGRERGQLRLRPHDGAAAAAPCMARTAQAQRQCAVARDIQC